MDGYDTSPPYASRYDHYEEGGEEGSSWGAIAFAAVIIFVIIAALVYYYFYYQPPTPGPNPNPAPGSNASFQWAIRQGTSQTTDTWTAGAGQAYRVNPSATGAFALNLNAPASAAGQQFLIINESAATVRVNAPGNNYAMNPRSNSSAIWMSQTQVNQLY